MIPEEDLVQTIKRKVGTTAVSRAKWLLWFAHQNVDDLEFLGDQEKCEEVGQLYIFCNPNLSSVPKVTRENLQWFKRWHRRISLGIRKLKRGRGWCHRLMTHYTFWVPAEYHLRKNGNPHPNYSFQFDFGISSPSQINRLLSKPTFKDVVAHRICRTLMAVESRLRRCPREGCGELFIQQGRQRYCSKQCGQTHRTRHHRLQNSPTKRKRQTMTRQQKKEEILQVTQSLPWGSGNPS